MSKLTKTPIKDLPTIAQIRRFFFYDPNEGILRWKISRSNRVTIGMPAGTKTSNGYLHVVIKTPKRKIRLGASRIVWAFMTGAWPKKFVDHADGNKTNNKWTNLREATREQNMANAKRKSNCRSGFKGVVFCTYTNRWRARLMKDRKIYEFGRHDTAQEAHAAYCEGTKRLNKQFARTG